MTIKTREHMAEARAIHLAMRMRAITYKEAKRLAKPLLEQVNSVARHIATKHKMKHREITFQDLGRNL